MFIFNKLKEYVISYRRFCYDEYIKLIFINCIQNGLYSIRHLKKRINIHTAYVKYSFERFYSTAFKKMVNNNELIDFTIICNGIEKHFLLNSDMKVFRYYIPSKTNCGSSSYEIFLNGNNLWRIYHRFTREYLEYDITGIILNGQPKKYLVEIYDFVSHGRFTLKYYVKDQSVILHKIKRMVYCKKDSYKDGVLIKSSPYTMTYHYVRN